MSWSIVIPYYNEAAFIGRTLKSLIHQTLKPDCIILVNNASSDESEEACRKVMATAPDIEVLYLDVPTPGQVYALSAGIEAVTTVFVAICDADTFYPPDYLACADRCFQTSGPEVLAVIAYYLNPRHGPLRRSFSAAHQLLAAHLLNRQCHSGGAGQCFRTEALRKVGGYAPDHWPFVLKDHELMHRILKIGRTKYHADFWCSPSPRRSDRRLVRWTLLERLIYHMTPFALKDWYFYRFLKQRFIARGMEDTRLRNLSPPQQED
ncbi:glycosyltransferase family 2 protein [Govanella unica]|uniref:Glycosyltransferase family 2 protein n=1 Tax=Govanella unica TaxID=2975056 RepID=A0A9X3TYR2_9PROT|nr:glycosyltransferase family 2 protein [Govania unica]MDA5194185.1 glycosyltransferase family 2 protein [Govania unica]